jgi:hypothetical protein
MALKGLDEDEKMTLSNTEGHSGTRGGAQSYNLISESGLYSLAFTSRKPEAKAFRKWVTAEVLPSIRKHGHYSNRGGRLDRIARQVKTDDPTILLERLEQLGVNKQANRRMADQGMAPCYIARYHNGGYLGQFQRKAADLRSSLRIKSRRTPLDRMGELPLSQNRHIKVVAERIIAERARDRGGPIPANEQALIIEEVARGTVHDDFSRLGPGRYGYGLHEDERRGLIIDVIRLPLVEHEEGA